MKPWKGALGAAVCSVTSAIEIYSAINTDNKLIIILDIAVAIFFACLANHFMYISSKHE